MFYPLNSKLHTTRALAERINVKYELCVYTRNEQALRARCAAQNNMLEYTMVDEYQACI